MTYDVVVVGGGAAGCLLAARLSEDRSTRVLLLEAGPGDRNLFVRMPIGSYELFGTKRDWDYRTAPVPGCKNRSLRWTRGRMLGGSTGINTMIYIRGNPLDYDDWVAAGNDGWSWDDVLPVFRSLEDQARGGCERWGTGGPVHVGDTTGQLPINDAFIDACEEEGIERNRDFNGAHQEGAGFYQVTSKDGLRVSAASAFLEPARGRPNLTVRTGARVDRVCFEGNRAVGVEVLKGRQRERILAGTVVLSGGAVASPLILQRSGVGPEDVLSRVGIEVRHARRGVGRNMRDHCHVPVLHRCSDPDATADRFDLRSELRMIKEVARWVISKRGWGTITGPEAGAFVRSRDDLDRPDLQYHFGASYWTAPGPLPRSDGPHFLIAPGLSRQRSTGFIEVRSDNPLIPPRIQPNYLEHPDDVRALMYGVRLARRIARAAPLAKYNAGLRLPEAPFDFDDDDSVEDFVRTNAQTVYHATGTCRMGPTEDDVVDNRLKAHGLEQLWIADTSVFPKLPTGNTMAATYMIAERASGFIQAQA